MVNKSQIRFSVVIPAYNEENYLGNTLSSLKEQDFSGTFEVIVVDNNCTDNTAKIAKKYGATLITEKNTGISWARQAGTEAAQGEIIVSTDADTTFSKDWLTTIDAAFKQSGKIVAVTGPCTFIDPPWWGTIYPKFLFGSVYIASKLLGRPSYITATNTAFKKSAWTGYDTKVAQGSDELGLLRQLKKQGKIVFLHNNPTYTSSRRLRRGLLYNFFVTFLYYYVLEYSLSRFFHNPLIGSAPNIREKFQSKVKAIRK